MTDRHDDLVGSQSFRRCDGQIGARVSALPLVLKSYNYLSSGNMQINGELGPSYALLPMKECCQIVSVLLAPVIVSYSSAIPYQGRDIPCQ